MANIKKLIKKYKHALQWDVKIITGDNIKTLEIKTDKENHVHNIYLPKNDVRDIEMLHEIGHAFLCENVHPLFSTAYIVGADKQAMNDIIPTFRACDDWFVDQWLFEIAKNEEKKEIEESFRLISSALKSGNLDNEILIGCSFIIAQAVKYLNVKAVFPENVKKIVDAFLSVNPEKPTIKKLETLVSRVLETFSPYRLELSGHDWKVTTAKD